MSCSEITVQILGDAADILVYVAQAQDAAAAAKIEAGRADAFTQQGAVSERNALASANAAADRAWLKP